MRKLIILAIGAGYLTFLSGSTLQRLSLTDMIQKSTMIVRGTVRPGTSATARGPLIYTHYQVAVTSAYKGTPGASVDVAVPGGVLNGLQQPVAGAPVLNSGEDCVMFLWTSRSGLTQVIGLSQGLFSVSKNSQGQLMVTRGAANSPIVDSTGQPVTDVSVAMPLTELASKIQAVLAGSSGQ